MTFTGGQATVIFAAQIPICFCLSLFCVIGLVGNLVMDFMLRRYGYTASMLYSY